MEFRKPEKREVRIEISPLIDVVFLLLIFFMVSTTFLQDSGLKLDLPESKYKEGGKGGALVIEIDSNGFIFYEGRKISTDELRGDIQKDIVESEEGNVVIKADKKAEHGIVVEVMNVIKDSGAKGVTVAARGPDR